jgi:hypothetical protein
MKIQMIAALITIASLAGCASTATSDQANAAPAEIKNKINTGEKLTDKELDELAGKTNFTATQLKKAAKKLGYRCSYFVVTGSHIKQKICSTKQQRDVRAEAAKSYVQDISRSNTVPAKL